MPDQGRRSPARLLAPIALVLVAAACAVVVLSSTASDGGGQTSDGASERRTTETSPRAGRERRRRRAFYVVKTDDTLDRIAAKTGVPVERLLELNPELDPLALVSGQRIKLRQ